MLNMAQPTMVSLFEQQAGSEIRLTENALAVLKRRYLRKGPDGQPAETVEQMFHRIASHVAAVEEQWGGNVAEAEAIFYDLVAGLRFMPNSPTFTGAGTPLGQLAACFHPDQPIITADGVKAIRDVEAGDLVLTHTGVFSTVLETMSRHTTELLEISVSRLPKPTLRITPEHPVLALRKEDVGTEACPEWMLAGQLRVGDYVALAVPTGVHDVAEIDLMDVLDPERYEARDGLVYRKTGVFHALFGSAFDSKTVPSWILELPYEKQEAFLAGVVRGDRTPFLSKNNYHTRIVMSNPSLVYEVWQVARRLGINAALGKTSMPSLATAQPYSCTLSGLKACELVSDVLGKPVPHTGHEWSRTIVQGGYALNPITAVSAVEFEGLVYNLEVENDHSYAANMVAVHNCFVLPISDDMGREPDGIFQTLRNMALIQQTGGGTGFSFSRLRPKGAIVRSSGGQATGPVGFMRVFDTACEIVSQGGARRGANMAVLRVDHPDIHEFIQCKRSEHAITNFNISVGVTDAFMRAVETDGTIDLVNPQDGKVWKTVRAREIFDDIVAGAHRNGEPGLLFLDTANRQNPCLHLGEYEATNPCGEQFLLPYENCCLGSVNLARHVRHGDNGHPAVDWEQLRETVEQATRFLDDVVDANAYVPAVPQLREAAQRTRRIGLGIMGLGDLLFCLGLRYGSEEAQELAAQVMEFIRYHATRTSIELARERGPFPEIQGSVYDPENLRWTPPWPLTPYTRLRKWGRPPLDWDTIVEGIRRHGIRNAAQTTVAPTGTIATIANCEAYGCEPVFALAYVRHVNDNGKDLELRYTSPLFLNALEQAGLDQETQERIIQQVVLTGSCQDVEEVPPHIREVFVVAGDVSAEEHVRMQAALQAFVDASISKCVAGDTLLLTEKGLLPIDALYLGESPDTFRTLNDPLRVADWGAPVAATEFYYGGERDTIRLTTDMGIRLEATPNHRVRVLESEGVISWRRMDELREGDYLVVPYDYPEALGRRYEFSRIYGAPYQPAKRTVAKSFSWPYKITRDLARLLGYLTADGYLGENWVQFVQSDDRIAGDAEAILRSRFGADVKRSMDRRREHLHVVQVNGRDLVRFFRDYLGMEGLASKHVPRCVTAAGPLIVREYLRGLTLDGYVSPQGHIVPLTTMSEQLAREAQALFLTVGIPTRLSRKKVDYTHKDGRKGSTGYVLTVLPEFRERFLETVGFAQKDKNETAWHLLPPPCQRRGGQIPATKDLCIALIQTKLPRVHSRRAEDYLRSTLSDLRQADCESLAADRVRHLLDLCADLAQTAEYRQLAEVVERKVVYAKVTSLSNGRAPVYDLHVPETNAFISNGLVSHNTINFPSTATPDDVARAFRLAWELGCKGLTVYVTGSREKEVLETEATRQAKQQPQPAALSTTVRPRPHRLEGATYHLSTPLGTAYLTINVNGEGEPFEVFLNVGKAGSDTAAVAEAIGRLISLILRIPSPLSATRRLKQVVKQLKGIGGGRPLGFGRDRVRSLPDGVAQGLAEHLGMIGPPEEEKEERMEQLALFPAGDLCPECGHAAVVNEEGCRHCYACGYSEC